MPRSTTALLALGVLAAAAGKAGGSEAALLPGFQACREFAEQDRWQQQGSGVRIYVNAPRLLAKRRRQLVIYATPNGNNIEQTFGCAPGNNRDWHFDIQHVGAQIRRLREVSADEDLVLAIVEAPKRSWPAFRQEHASANAVIEQIVQDLAREVEATGIVLAGHSGGGSFLFGWLEAVDEIPRSIERFAFLDANYSFSAERGHGEKLLAWLRGSPSRKLIVIAYDDREVTLNGKKIVGPTGGTYRATERMVECFSRQSPFVTAAAGSFVHRRAMDGQIEFFIHPNPTRKILHTALVGDMNGLLHALALGRNTETAWGQFGGPRAYSAWIQPEPIREPSPFSRSRVVLGLPARPGMAPSGSQFLRQIANLPRADREAAILRELAAGNVPDFLRTLRPIALAASDSAGVSRRGTCFVMPDYLSVGSNDDFFRMPMTPQTAQTIASKANARLITAQLSDTIARQAELHLEPRPLTLDRETAATFYQHHQIIEQQRRGHPLGLLVAGIKKDVVITNRLLERPQRVAIYGWHYPEGSAIQPLYTGHVDWYVDYSHGIRLMSDEMIVDGQWRRTGDVLKDQDLCDLLSSEGPIVAEYQLKP